MLLSRAGEFRLDAYRFSRYANTRVISCECVVEYDVEWSREWPSGSCVLLSRGWEGFRIDLRNMSLCLKRGCLFVLLWNFMKQITNPLYTTQNC